MAKIGYLFLSRSLSTREEDLNWMRDFGCDRIIEEETIQEKMRPQWRKMVTELAKGDVVVVSKLSNAFRGLRELGAFLGLRHQYGIRLVSIHDRIDTSGELFPATTPVDVLDAFGNLPAEAISARRSSARVLRLRKDQVVPPKTQLRLDKEKMIVSMYQAGHQVEDIWKVSGYKSRTSVFRVLRRAGVEPNRKPTSGARHESVEKE
jgi:DNA invertase Pin-like site-specific DNA recombinase